MLTNILCKYFPIFLSKPRKSCATANTMPLYLLVDSRCSFFLFWSQKINSGQILSCEGLQKNLFWCCSSTFPCRGHGPEDGNMTKERSEKLSFWFIKNPSQISHTSKDGFLASARKKGWFFQQQMYECYKICSYLLFLQFRFIPLFSKLDASSNITILSTEIKSSCLIFLVPYTLITKL